MKKIIIVLFAGALLTAFINFDQLKAQTISEDFKKSSVSKINELINDNYVFPDMATATSKHLLQQLDAGRFVKDTTVIQFSRSLTAEVQSINHDKHMRVMTGATGSPTRPAGNTDGGFKEVKILDGNIGYIDLRLFFPASFASTFADKHMKTLANTDAIIIDLRNNGGGNPDMVQYLCSYFFPDKVHLNSLYSRLTNSTREFWTIPVEGKKLEHIPLFVLTSKKTFSGAEEFSYNMQTQKRATLIGETTGGGANPGGVYEINKELNIFIPTGTAINPVTKTNWEGKGVKPDIELPADQALAKATQLAADAVKKYSPLNK